VGELPTSAERLARLQEILGQVPEDAHRQQLLAGLGTAGLPDGLRIGAAIAERAGPLVAAQVASELAVDVSKLTLPPGLRQQVQAVVVGAYDDSDRMGGLRAAQYAATGNAAFLELAARERRTLEQLATVRAATAGGASSSEARSAYGQLFGGDIIVNRSGYLLRLPASLDVDRVTQGLQNVLGNALENATPTERALFSRGTWVNAGSGLVYYPRNSPTPMARNGAIVQVTPAEALAAPEPARAVARGAGPHTVVPPGAEVRVPSIRTR
jgi:hypothetical protein